MFLLPLEIIIHINEHIYTSFRVWRCSIPLRYSSFYIDFLFFGIFREKGILRRQFILFEEGKVSARDRIFGKFPGAAAINEYGVAGTHPAMAVLCRFLCR